jgi:hypothetical protein
MAVPEHSKKSIVVAGDVVIDHHHYEAERPGTNSGSRIAVREVRQAGGAAMLARLTDELIARSARRTSAKNAEARARYEEALLNWRKTSEGNCPEEPVPSPTWENNWKVMPVAARVEKIDTSDIGGVHAYGVWRPCRHAPNVPGRKPSGGGKEKKAWRLDDRLGYGDDARPSEYPLLRGAPGATVLVLDDADLGFRAAQHARAWALPTGASGDNAWILLKMSGSIARGDLWHRVIDQ